MRQTLQVLRVARALLALAGVLLLCFAGGLALQIGWQSVQGTLIVGPAASPTAQPSLSPTPVPPSTLAPSPTLAAVPTGTTPPRPTKTPRATTTPRPAPTATATSEALTYTVQAGDTLAGIAERFGVSVAELVAANPDLDPTLLPIDYVLRIPHP